LAAEAGARYPLTTTSTFSSLFFAMAQDKPPQDLMHYGHLMQEAARGVVRAALKRAATPAGPPGDHHFYLTFKTGAPGVSGPPDILAAYPDEMSIILQHEFWDLAPGETFFSVTLKFSGQEKRLSIPYAAVTRFIDPSVQFHLQFEPPETEATAALPEPEPAAKPAPVESKPRPSTPSDEPNVVSLDQFRKK
jgi:hypothetical protein